MEAFTELLKHLPADSGLGLALVQHLDPKHESALTEILSRVTAMSVSEVANDQAVLANHVYIARYAINDGIIESNHPQGPTPRWEQSVRRCKSPGGQRDIPCWARVVESGRGKAPTVNTVMARMVVELMLAE